MNNSKNTKVIEKVSLLGMFLFLFPYKSNSAIQNALSCIYTAPVKTLDCFYNTLFLLTFIFLIETFVWNSLFL